MYTREGHASGELAERTEAPRALSVAVGAESHSRLRASKALFILAAGLSFLFSVYLWFLFDREQGMFVGLWVPSILSLGALLLAGTGRER